MKHLFFDIQVNGYAGTDFNGNDLGLENLEKACSKLRDDGVEGIFATIITASLEDMVSKLNMVYREMDDPLEQADTLDACLQAMRSPTARSNNRCWRRSRLVMPAPTVSRF